MVIDFSDPGSPVLLHERQIANLVAFSPIDGGVVTVVESRVSVLEDAPGLPVKGQAPAEGDGNDLDIQGSIGVIADGFGGIVVLDTSTPTEPTVLSRLRIDGWSDGVRLSSSAALVRQRDRVVSVDLADPRHPVVAGEYSANMRINSLEIEDGIAIAAGYDTTVEAGVITEQFTDVVILDVADPLHPTEVSRINVGPYAWWETEARILGDIAVVSYQPTIQTFDISDPESPVLLDSFDVGDLHLSGFVRNFDLIGSFAVFTANSPTMAVDCSDPSNLRWAPEFPRFHLYLHRTIGENLSAIYRAPEGPSIADTSDPLDPAFFAAPVSSSWWEPGTVVGNTWLRPSGPYLDVLSLECRPPEAEFRWFGAGRTIWFEDRSHYQVETRNWDFGDGTTLTTGSHKANHTYASNGPYTVTLEVVSDNGSDTISHIVWVGAKVFDDGFETGDTSHWE